MSAPCGHENAELVIHRVDDGCRIAAITDPSELDYKRWNTMRYCPDCGKVQWTQPRPGPWGTPTEAEKESIAWMQAGYP